MTDESLPIDYSKVNVGIECVCDTMDYVGLTMVERWWVARSIELSAAAILGINIEEFNEKWEEKFPKLQQDIKLLLEDSSES